jgi:hypothetical protein
MARKDPRIDAYIAKSADFAKPILKHLRKMVHAGCPEVAETLKWSMPHFDYKGVMCGMAAQAALRVRVLERVAGFRWGQKRGENGDGQLRLHQVAGGFA